MLFFTVGITHRNKLSNNDCVTSNEFVVTVNEVDRWEIRLRRKFEIKRNQLRREKIESQCGRWLATVGGSIVYLFPLLRGVAYSNPSRQYTSRMPLPPRLHFHEGTRMRERFAHASVSPTSCHPALLPLFHIILYAYGSPRRWHPRHRESLLRRRICERFRCRLLAKGTARRRDDMVDRCWTEQLLIWRCGMKEIYNAALSRPGERAIIPENAIGNSKLGAIGNEESE